MYNFSKKFRLHNFNQFNLIFKKNKKIVSKEIVIFWMENRFKYPRIGILIKKKVLKNHAKEII